VQLLGEALFNTRKTEAAYNSFGNEIRSPSTAEQYGAGAGIRVDLGRDWQTDVGASYSNNHTDYAVFQNGTRAATVDMEAGVWSFDAKADGALFAAPGGQARLAVGGQYRRETFDSRGSSTNTGGEDARDVSGVFSELLIPLIGRGNVRPGAQRLELSIAGRYEDYSDVGSTANPKIGLAWSPVAALNLRGTYGTSFRAPSFYESNTTAQPVRPIAYSIPDPLSTAPSGTTTTIALYGNTGTLRPEEATNWTVGLDFSPEAAPGLSLSVTYFDIDFTDRIAEPLITGFSDMLFNEAQHPDFIMRNPDPALVAAYLDSPRFLNFSGGPVAVGDVGVIADNRRVNVSSVRESGLDFSLSYGLSAGADQFIFQVGGAYLFEKLNQATLGAPPVDAYNAVFYPADLRLRNSVGWSRGAFGATLFLNYVDSYEDVRPGRESVIPSWSTMDLTARYRFLDSQSWLRGITLSLAALNVMDKAPPLVINNGFNFDATNASGVGRHLSISVVKEW
jgi:outer membrane receptor protein involved in Fe transport